MVLFCLRPIVGIHQERAEWSGFTICRSYTKLTIPQVSANSRLVFDDFEGRSY